MSIHNQSSGIKPELPCKAKDRRSLYQKLASQVLLKNNRIGIVFSQLRAEPVQWIVQEYRIALAMHVQQNYSYDSFDHAKEMRAVERAILKTVHDLQGKFDVLPMESGWSYKTAPNLSKEEFAPHFSRRPDLPSSAVPQSSVSAAQHISSTAFKVNEEAYEKFVMPWVDQHSEEDAARLFPEWPNHGFSDELDYIGSSEFYMLTNRFDTATRRYPKGPFNTSSWLGRLLFVFADKRKMSDRDMKAMAALFTEKYGEGWIDRVDDILKAPVSYALGREKSWSKWKHTEEIFAAYTWREARDTGLTSSLFELDAMSSGSQHMLASTGLLEVLDSHSNLNSPNFIHPKDRLTVSMRNALVHLPGLANPETKDLREIADDTMSPLMYGGRVPAVLASLLGIEKKDGEWLLGDDDDPKELEVPAPFDRLTAGLTDNREILKKLNRPASRIVRAFGSTFPWFKPLYEAAKDSWEAGWKRDGVPGSIVKQDGYVLQPASYRTDRRSTHRVEVTLPDGSTDSVTTLNVDLNAEGTPALAATTQCDDARCLDGWIARGANRGTPMATNHDAVMIPFTERDNAVSDYREAFEELHGIKLLDPNAVMVRH